MDLPQIEPVWVKIWLGATSILLGGGVKFDQLSAHSAQILARFGEALPVAAKVGLGLARISYGSAKSLLVPNNVWAMFLLGSCALWHVRWCLDSRTACVLTRGWREHCDFKEEWRLRLRAPPLSHHSHCRIVPQNIGWLHADCLALCSRKVLELVRHHAESGARQNERSSRFLDRSLTSRRSVCAHRWGVCAQRRKTDERCRPV